jgi:hypothetical protein
MAGTEWTLSVYQDFMIRAYVEGPTSDELVADNSKVMYPPKLPPEAYQYFMSKNGTTPGGLPGVVKGGEIRPVTEGVAANRDVTGYEVARIDNFDPNAGPQFGVKTVIATSLTGLDYNDVAFGGLAQGWYAYAVKAHYTNGDTSVWAYSNIVGHLMEVAITFEVSLSTGDPPEGVAITMAGEDWPYEIYFGITDVTGFLTFDPVWKGIYYINAQKVGYDVYEIFDYNAVADDSIIIILGEKRYPPRNLWVDPLTSWAYWDWPVVFAVIEDFEGSDWPPVGWQSLTNSCGWFLTTDGSGPNWPIPTWDSQYACANDDLCGSGKDGSVDYLITPALDLRESDDFYMTFDSYYDGAYGQLAFVEYSYDAGATWEVLHALAPNPGSWDLIDLDLSAYSGMSAQHPIWFAFHADDAGFWASGWAIDNVFIANGEANAMDFWVFLDGAFVSATDTITFHYPFLTYGVTYEASVAARYTSGLSEKIYYTFVSEYLIPPRNLDGLSFDDAVELWWEPPIGPPITYEYEVLGEEPRTEMPDPNIDYSPVVRTISVTGGGSNRDQWDVQFTFVPGFAGGEAGVETDKDYIYTSNWHSGNGTFYKYELDGTYLGPFIISGCQDVRDLAYEDNEDLFYGSNAGTQVWGMDFVGQTVVNTISAPTATRAIAFDLINDGFWANNWSTDITLFDKTGAFVQSFPVGAFGSHYGFGYDPWTDGGPYLWAFSQDGSGGELIQYEIATGSIVFNMSVYPYVGGSSPAGGLFTHCSMIYPGIATIGGTNQNELIWGMELVECGTPPPPPWDVHANLIGYTVYRDFENIAYVPYNGEDTTYYYDLGLEPLTYEYDVTAMYDLTPYGFPGDTGESMMEGPVFITVEYGWPLPFEEPWTSGTFELNIWSHDDNWRINGQIGNPEPASEFTWDPVLTDYRSDLTSYPLDGINLNDPFIDGCIWFDVDIRLDDRNTTGGETLSIEVGNEDGWHKLIEYDNADGSFDWTGHHFDITAWGFQNIFRVRFVAEGDNSSDILSWFVDNIYVYRTCSGPYDLTAEQVDYIEIHLNWHSPFVCGGGGGGAGQWIHWDSGENTGGIGLQGGGTFSVASHWDPGMITPYEGMSITKVRFVPFDDALTSTFMMKVWEGANAGTLLYEQEATGLVLGSWNEIEFTTPVPLDVTKELWFGYTTVSADGEHPAGHDPGPAIAGYGDMITLDGTSWDPLSGYGLDYNWTLQAYVASADGETTQLVPLTDMTAYNTPDAGLSEEVGAVNIPAPSDANRTLQGYNVYKFGEFLDFTADTFYVDIIDSNGTYTYDVTAVYEDCESDTAATETIDAVGIGIEELLADGNIAVFPNPAREVVNIVSTDDITYITMLNNVGQLVYNKKVVNDNVLEINVTGFEAGIYMIKIETAENIIIEKVLITH